MGSDNRISLQKLEVFCKVVDLGSVRKAAEQLYVSQPVISAHLRSLQERIGADLFQRDGRGIGLTEAGSEAYLWATSVLRSRIDLDETLGNLSAGASGSASIGSSITVGNTLLTPHLIDFRRDNPEVRLRLELSGVETALNGLASGRHDFCVVATDAVLDAHSFEAEMVAEPPFALLASGANVDLPSLIDAADLVKLDYVCPISDQAIRRSQDHALASLGVVNRKVVMELGTGEAIRQVVAADLGVALLWRVSAQADIAAGTLREIVIRDVDLRDKLYVVQRPGKVLSPLQRRLRDSLVTRLRTEFADTSEV